MRNIQKADVLGDLKCLRDKSFKFKKLLSILKFPLVYACINLLSQGKVSLFSNNLLDLMEWLAGTGNQWTKDMERAELAAYIIEQISLAESIDCKRHSNVDLIKLFQ